MSSSTGSSTRESGGVELWLLSKANLRPDPSLCLRFDQLRAGEVGRHPAGVSGQERSTGHRRMRADQEVGQDRDARAALAPIAGVRVAGEKGGRERNLLESYDRGQ